MTADPVYCIDTSSILEARIRSYPPDVFATLWEKIEGLIAVGRLLASEEVLHELGRQSDDTYRWAKDQAGLFVPLDRGQTDEVSRIEGAFPHLVHRIKNRSAADPFVIALAKLRGYTIITEENKSTSPQKPKIPDVCTSYGIKCIKFLEVIRHEKWTF